jgi:DNA repair protein RadA/Sms
MPGQMAPRLREASKLGFKTAIIPKSLRGPRPSGLEEGWPIGLEVVEARSIQQALEAALLPSPADAPKGRKVA